MTDALAALLPPLVVGGAFVAIAVAVKRYADRERRAEEQTDQHRHGASPSTPNGESAERRTGDFE